MMVQKVSVPGAVADTGATWTASTVCLFISTRTVASFFSVRLAVQIALQQLLVEDAAVLVTGVAFVEYFEDGARRL